jgi:hypothetical protein
VTPVMWDDQDAALVIVSEDCPDCGEGLYDTGCDAPGCAGFCCMDCGTGCDMEFNPENGACVRALDDESEDERAERIDRERAAFGLSPVSHADAGVVELSAVEADGAEVGS